MPSVRRMSGKTCFMSRSLKPDVFYSLRPSDWIALSGLNIAGVPDPGALPGAAIGVPLWGVAGGRRDPRESF